MAEQYLTLAGKTDAAFRALVEYLRVFDEPTIVIMFGDHQPSVEQGFLDLAYGVTQEQMTMEQYMGKYYVPFVIWANYPLPGTGPETTSLNFLGQYLLRYAGIAAPPTGTSCGSSRRSCPPSPSWAIRTRRAGLQPSGDQRFHRPD